MPLYTTIPSQSSKSLLHLSVSFSLSRALAAVLTAQELAEWSAQDSLGPFTSCTSAQHVLSLPCRHHNLNR